MTKSVQFLFATMNGALFERNPKVLACARDYLVVDQYPEKGSFTQHCRPHTISARESGLSKSRNLALKNATADLCYLCDDDIALAPNAPERVRGAFERHPDSDILIFARGTSFGSATPARSLAGRSRKVLPASLRILGASSIQIAFRRERVLGRGIQFDERFGLGAEFPTSEEALFLHDCLRAGLKISWVDTLVATHASNSSGTCYANRELAVAKGAMLSRLFGSKRRFAGLAFALKSLPSYSEHMNFFGFIEALERGARLYADAPAALGGPRLTTAVSHPDSLAFFAALNQTGIRYAAWKDLNELPKFHAGNSEIDLYVHPEEMPAFRSFCVEQGYAEFVNRLDLYGGKISHFIRFAHARHFHLHVHSALLTGDHGAKEYDLSSLVQSDFFDGPLHEEVRTVAPHSELAIGMIRLILKSKNPSAVKIEELHHLRAISSEERLKLAFEWVGVKVDLSQLARHSLTRLLSGEDAEFESLPRFEEELSSLRRTSVAQTWLNRLRMRLSNIRARRDALTNKILSGQGQGEPVAPTVAVIGVDGSGKTTLCDAVERILRPKVSVKRIYLGSNRETYSSLTRLAYLASGTAGRAQTAWPQVQWALDLKWLMRALLEYSKCCDRVSEIRRGHRYAREGVLVLFERYPIKQLFDYPAMISAVERGEIDLSGPLGDKTHRILARIDLLLNSLPQPDSTLLIQTHFDQIASRREMAPEEVEDIQHKLALLDRFEGTDQPGFQVISNEADLEATLEDVLHTVSQTLCSRNS